MAGNPGLDNVSIYRNLGLLKVSTSQFAASIPMTVGDNPGRIYKGDFDGDGKVDVVMYYGAGTNATMLTVLHNISTVGNISFTRIDLINPSAVTVATVADLDGDGKPEIITTSETGNRISIFKNTHTTGALTAASFAAPFNITVTAPRGLTTGDLNLDVKPEIIITRAANLLVVYENLITPTIPTIASFTPISGPVGTTVMITGTSFDPVAANNIVTFNGVTAVVTASTSTTITATVPASATTGKIAVTVGSLTATSATDFTVTAPTATITITQQPQGTTVCEGATATMTVAATGATNLTYKWQFSATVAGTYTDIANGAGYSNTSTSTLSINTTGLFGAGFYRCAVSGDFASPVFSDAAHLVVNTSASCASNTPPVFAPKSASTEIGGSATIDLTALITDVDNNVILTTLTVVGQPASGADVTIMNGVLTLDYEGTDFSGTDIITIRVCDAFNACTQQQFSIEVVGNIKVYNAVSPNDDGKNDIFLLEYIDLLPSTRTNTVTIYNRWGDLVFETRDYNNTDRVFKGKGKNGNDLPSGTYYYKIKFGDPDVEMMKGYLVLKR